MNLIKDQILYKYIALVVGVLVIVFISYSIRRYAGDKIAFHYAVIEFITYVRQQINYFCTPTAQIIKEYNDPILTRNGFFNDDALESNRYLDHRGKKLLEEFFTKLGRSSAEEQTANCDYVIEGLTGLVKEYENDAEKKYKAYSTLTLIMGLMLLIALI